MDKTVAFRARSDEELLTAGTAVDVCSRFTGTWCDGFEITEVTGDAYRIRRLSDGSVLPTEFSVNDVRAQRPKKSGLWWY